VGTPDQLMELLDSLYGAQAHRTSAGAADFWGTLLQQPDHVLNTDLPDANLVAWHAAGLLPPTHAAKDPADRPTALDIGCGLGRNAGWLAAQGFSVTGIDIAEPALAEARRRAGGPSDHGEQAAYLVVDFLREEVPGGPFDLVYDSGCFHHLAPHRRISYLAALDVALAPDGVFGICTFAAGRMGTTADDAQLLRQGSLEGGIGYSLDELAAVFGDLELVSGASQPTADEVGSPVFSQEFLHAALFRRS
jgi:SAM-dependent methyltransferase